jgi:hypothetical protein
MKSLEVLSVADAAQQIGIREKTLRRRINRGTVAVDTLIGKQVIHRDEVKALRKAEIAKKKKRS